MQIEDEKAELINDTMIQAPSVQSFKFIFSLPAVVGFVCVIKCNKTSVKWHSYANVFLSVWSRFECGNKQKCWAEKLALCCLTSVQ